MCIGGEKMKKVLLSIIIGIIVTINGELLIPDKYSINLSYECIQNSNGYVFMPELYVYFPKGHPHSDNPKNIKRNYFTIAFLPNSANISNYQTLYSFLSGDLKKLSPEECNKFIGLKIQGDMDHFSQYFKHDLEISKNLGLE